MMSPKPSGRRYWCPETERYAPASALISFLDNGWEVKKVEIDQINYSSGRFSTIYHFLLGRKGEAVHMPVISSPSISRLLKNHQWVVTHRPESPHNKATSNPVAIPAN